MRPGLPAQHLGRCRCGTGQFDTPAVETNSHHIAWQRLTRTMSEHAAKQLLATAVAKGEAADRCNRITYSTDEGIFRIYAQA